MRERLIDRFVELANSKNISVNKVPDNTVSEFMARHNIGPSEKWAARSSENKVVSNIALQ